jgi:hypothetical protein
MTTAGQPKRILFILKLRQVSGGVGKELKSAGLSNSARYVQEMLARNEMITKLVQVVDNNQIDREVTLFQPDIVIIEALWVVPSKFAILTKLHPNVQWIVRLHSELPFLANEGSAMEWITACANIHNVYVGTNSPFAQRDLKRYLALNGLQHKLLFLPNYYPVETKTTNAELFWDPGEVINIGCFGAIRPLKNQLVQAAAAVEFANRHKLRCRFHINAERVEGRGDAILKNLRAFFEPLEYHELVEHQWLDKDDFLAVVRQMDVGMQMSLSETFNIVSADFINEDIPILASREIDWMPKFFTASPTNVDSMVRGLERILFYDRHFIWLNLQRKALRKYVNNSEKVWVAQIHQR